jgi:molybdate transport system ATP-binding protein
VSERRSALHVRVDKRRGAFRLEAEFALPTPGVIALFGRSGCGKTTLSHVIAGLLEPDSGRIELDGRVLLDTAAGTVIPAERREIGYVFQDARLFPHLSVAGNLAYAERRAERRAGTHAARRPRHPDRDTVVQLLALAPLLERRPYSLSGGERQRVAIARALLSEPRLLLLDEPLASLDVARREEVLPYLETLRDEIAVPIIYVSHQFDEVLRLATHIVLLDAGRILAQGDLGAVSLLPALRAIVGPDAVGAILSAVVLGSDADSGLLRVRIGRGELQIRASGRDTVGHHEILRLQVLARDVIVALEEPRASSVRNHLRGVVTVVAVDDAETDLISIDIGGATLLARVTRVATRALGLQAGVPVWALVKSVTLRGRPPPKQPLVESQA